MTAIDNDNYISARFPFCYQPKPQISVIEDLKNYCWRNCFGSPNNIEVHFTRGTDPSDRVWRGKSHVYFLRNVYSFLNQITQITSLSNRLTVMWFSPLCVPIIIVQRFIVHDRKNGSCILSRPTTSNESHFGAVLDFSANCCHIILT